MADISALTKYFPKVSETFEDNLSSSIGAGASIVPVNSITEYDDGDIAVIVVEPGTANQAVFVGEVNGNQFENCHWTEGNVGIGHANGVTVVDYITATHMDMVSVGIQKEHNQDGTHKTVHADAIYVDGTPLSYLLPPTGVILPFGGTSAPSGWLLCQGQAIDRTTYAALFAVFGSTFGPGDGTTTFNLPNLKGKVPVGQDTGQTEFDVLGETGGEKAHTLTIPEMPSHNHSFGITVGTAGATPGLVDGPHSTSSGTPSTANTGGGGSHNNLQPYIITNYIVKT